MLLSTPNGEENPFKRGLSEQPAAAALDWSLDLPFTSCTTYSLGRHFLQHARTVNTQRSRKQRVKREHTVFSIEAAPGDRKVSMVCMMLKVTLHHQEHVRSLDGPGTSFKVAYDN